MMNVTFPAFPAPLEQFAKSDAILIDLDNTDWSMDFMRHLLHEYGQRLLPYVEQTLNALYGNNPLFGGALDRESLAQIIDRAYNLAKSGSHGIDAAVLRPLINALVLLVLAAQ